MKACWSRKQSESSWNATGKKGTDFVIEAEHSKHHEYGMFNLSNNRVKPIEVMILVEQRTVTMEVDTGASLTVINENTFKQFDKPLEKSTVHLQTYTKEEIPAMFQFLTMAKPSPYQSL